MQYGNLQKYQNPNPLQRWLIDRFLSAVRDLLPVDARTVLDVGCAEGFVGAYLRSQTGDWGSFVGVDLDGAAMLRGRALTNLALCAYADAVALPFQSVSFDLVLCTEVLEHLQFPGAVLKEMHRVSRSYVLLSVPHEPWFQMLNALRGKHLARFGNDPEHRNRWNPSQFAEFVSQELHIIERVSAFPWYLLLCLRGD